MLTGSPSPNITTPTCKQRVVRLCNQWGWGGKNSLLLSKPREFEMIVGRLRSFSHVVTEEVLPKARVSLPRPPSSRGSWRSTRRRAWWCPTWWWRGWASGSPSAPVPLCAFSTPRRWSTCRTLTSPHLSTTRYLVRHAEPQLPGLRHAGDKHVCGQVI